MVAVGVARVTVAAVVSVGVNVASTPSTGGNDVGVIGCGGKVGTSPGAMK